MKTHLVILFFLSLSPGFSCKEGTIMNKEEASLIPFTIKDFRINNDHFSEFIRAKESGILSDYQSTIWASVIRNYAENEDAGGVTMFEAIQTFGNGFETISNNELNEYQVREWSHYENHAYQSDWELSLWHLAQ